MSYPISYAEHLRYPAPPFRMSLPEQYKPNLKRICFCCSLLFLAISHVAHTCCNSPILHSFGFSLDCTLFVGVTLPYTPKAESVFLTVSKEARPWSDVV